MQRQDSTETGLEWFLDSDVAADTRAMFEKAQRNGASDAAAIRLVRVGLQEHLADDEDYPDVILALAWAVAVRGKSRVPNSLLEEVTAVIENQMSVARFTDPTSVRARLERERRFLLALKGRRPQRRSAMSGRTESPEALYRQGDWFVAPLARGGYALGLAARSSGKGGVLAYFFGPRLNEVPAATGVPTRTSGEAILIVRTDDSALRDGTWPVIGASEPWNPDAWRVPTFGRVDRFNPAKAWLVTYADPDIDRTLREEPTSPERAKTTSNGRRTGDGGSGKATRPTTLTLGATATA